MKLGLTGSIGMGKSTVAKMFAEFGVHVWDADRIVKSLYANDQGLFDLVKTLVPEAAQSPINFDILREAIREDDSIISALEAYIHPKVSEDRVEFLASVDGTKLCDIPLLYENDMASEFDHVIVVSAQFEVQFERVMARETMTKPVFDMILARQMPDVEKRERADFVIDTSVTLEDTRRQVETILKDIGVLNA